MMIDHEVADLRLAIARLSESVTRLQTIVLASLRVGARAAESCEIVNEWFEELGLKRGPGQADRRFLGGLPTIRGWVIERFEQTGDLNLPKPIDCFGCNSKRGEAWATWLAEHPTLRCLHIEASG